MAAYALQTLAQLPEAYQAFGPLVDILPIIACCWPLSGRPPWASAEAQLNSDLHFSGGGLRASTAFCV